MVEGPAAVLGDADEIFNPHAEFPGQVDARFVAENVAHLKRRIVPGH